MRGRFPIDSEIRLIVDHQSQACRCAAKNSAKVIGSRPSNCRTLSVGGITKRRKLMQAHHLADAPSILPHAAHRFHCGGIRNSHVAGLRRRADCNAACVAAFAQRKTNAVITWVVQRCRLNITLLRRTKIAARQIARIRRFSGSRISRFGYRRETARCSLLQRVIY